MTALDELKFPIGKWVSPTTFNDEIRKENIQRITALPQRLAKLVEGWSNLRLDTPYRPEGWTVRQLIHHIADSHINSYVRFRWTMTEDTPMIKAYDQDGWSGLIDAKTEDVAVSLSILAGIHRRWMTLVSSFTEADFNRELGHPEWKHNLSLDMMLSLYAWHGDHHYEHITRLAEREGWV
jgi:hypothetical protein